MSLIQNSGQEIIRNCPVYLGGWGLPKKTGNSGKYEGITVRFAGMPDPKM